MPHDARPGKTAIPELLAPAGSPEAFRAAVAAGADAIYLSGKRFGARKYAPNFSDTEIEEAVKYAHAHGIRVYVTVNTLVHDRELAGVMDYLVRLWSMGVDAVLLQDTGVALLAQKYLPGLTIHASTQMTIHNAEGVRWAHEHGFSRVVLSRELTLDEVTRVADETEDTGTGLEVFAHGALCYSYSGQCLLSSMIGGRSGNRGMCAQPCRKPYTLVQGGTDGYGRPGRLEDVPVREKYLLSPKDLCTYRHLPDLVRSRVISLKIEGRMKSPEYVAMVVSTYRRALDALAAGRWTPSDGAERDLLLAFNRGFTGGYLSGERYEKLMGRDAPDNRGLLIGRVERYDRTRSAARVRPFSPVLPHTGDGLYIVHPDTPEKGRGFALNTSPVQDPAGYILVLPGPVPEGAMVYITSSRESSARARRIIAKPPPDLLRLVPVDLEISVDPEGSLRIDGTIHRPDGTSIPVSYSPGRCLEPARTHPLAPVQLEQQMRKTGGTPFTVSSCHLRYDGDLFAPVSLLNDLRREFFCRAGERLQAASRPAEDVVEQARQRLRALRPVPSSDSIPAGNAGGDALLRLSVYTGSLEGVQEAVTAGADTVCFEPVYSTAGHLCGGATPNPSLRSQVLAALDCCRQTGALLVWKFPRIVHDSQLDLFIPEAVFLHQHGLAACMSGNPGTTRALKRAVPSLTLHGSTGLNIFNHAAATRAGTSCTLLTLSPELSREEIGTLTSLARSSGDAPVFSLIVQGSSGVMVTEDCIPRLLLHCRENNHRPGFLGIRDETGRVFPVRADDNCRTHIVNAAELCLIDLLPSVRDAGITEIVIDARHRPPAYARRMVLIYREALEIIRNTTGTSCRDGLLHLKDQVKEIALGGITAGHFVRGLKE